MTLPEKFNKVITGIISGLILPFITAMIIFLFARGDPDLQTWLKKIAEANIITHIITLCVFPNILIFLLFNNFDMLKASKGVLGITIVWFVLVFAVKFLV
jgi:hypothetical protein